MDDIQAKYSFLPWVRQGLATRINQVDRLRPSSPGEAILLSGSDLTLRLKVKGERPGFLPGMPDQELEMETSPKTIKLYGPEDIVGIEQRAIVKTEPAAGVHNFESNFVPYIEFYEEDFPWRYTPLAPNRDRLRPWLALVVLKESEFSRVRFRLGDVLPAISLTSDDPVFPPADQLWAWAHVQVTGNLKGAASSPLPQDRLNAIIQSDPNLACSRILCPRKLEPRTLYVAFLLPAFERGRLAGLGAPGEVIDATDIQLGAWGHGQDHFSGFQRFQHQFPIYYEWRFWTGQEGEDFQTMAQQIQPVNAHDLPVGLGKRWVDVQSPGYQLRYAGGEPPNQGALLMNGALRLPDSAIPDLLNEESASAAAFTHDLAALVNLEEDLKIGEDLPEDHLYGTNPFFAEEGESIYDDPIITPPLYGRWHAGRKRVDAAGQSNWVDQLNLDPRHRIAAGLGAEVVRRHQENYMDRAWKQFGELFEVNQLLRQTQFTLEISKRIFQKHLVPLRPAQLFSLSSSIHAVMRYGSGLSFKGLIKSKKVPDAMATLAYEKITRPGGALMKRASGAGSNPTKQAAEITEMGIANNKLTEVLSATNSPGTTVGPGLEPPVQRLLARAATDLRTASVPNWKTDALAKNGVQGGPEAFKLGLEEFGDFFKKNFWKWPSKAAIKLDRSFVEKVIQNIDPGNTVLKRMKQQLPELAQERDGDEENLLQPILAAPSFPDSTYREILRLSPDHLIPNLDLMPPNTAAVMELNRAFIESFMVGINHEMARELLWREYPTDQRGTYFRHFWDTTDKSRLDNEEGNDIQPIHAWQATLLGTHQDTDSETEPLVLMLRSDLLKRYPNTVVYMEKGKRQGSAWRTNPRDLAGEKIYPVFQARVQADIFCLGFSISQEAATTDPGWFFVLEERPGEVHFGLNSPEQLEEEDSLDTWDDLNWQHLPYISNCIDLNRDSPKSPTNGADIRWGRGEGYVPNDPASGDGCAATMAWILYQKPVKIAIHASTMLISKS